jgi:hypothetical protein
VRAVGAVEWRYTIGQLCDGELWVHTLAFFGLLDLGMLGCQLGRFHF